MQILNELSSLCNAFLPWPLVSLAGRSRATQKVQNSARPTAQVGQIAGLLPLVAAWMVAVTRFGLGPETVQAALDWPDSSAGYSPAPAANSFQSVLLSALLRPPPPPEQHTSNDFLLGPTKTKK